MGRKRKSAAPAKKAAGDACAPKKKKLESHIIDGLEARFEYEADQLTSKWVCYSKKFNRILAEAYNAKKSEIELVVPSGAALTVMFEKMVQKNKKTGWERRIRVALKNDDDDAFYVLEWQDDSTNWNPYNVAMSIELEKAFQAGQKTFTMQSSYEMNLKKMTQTNTKTKFSRAIKRTVQEGDVPTDYEDDDGDDNKEAINNSASTSDVKEEEAPAKSGRRKTKGKSGGGKKREELTKSTVKTVVVKKGRAPVDDKCPLANKTGVYEIGKIIWDCMLNQTNISNNNNKYYLIQLLQEEGKNAYHVWQRWGRVGYNGQTNLVNCGGNLDQAKQIFSKKFRDKTGNDWSDKDSFEKVGGKYDLLKMDYSAEGSSEDQVDAEKTQVSSSEEKKEVPESKLAKSLQDLVQLICDVKSMEDAVVEMKYDAKKVPLGKLTKDQIKAGYTALSKIESLIEKKDLGRNLQEACSDFYTRIPHEFGMQTPPLITTPQMVKKKIELLEALEDIEIAIKMLKGGNMSENPVDRHYHQLHCALDPLSHDDEELKLVSKYLQQTHASTHNQYKMELLDVFSCDKEGEADNFLDYGNRMLLWHGSRLTNWAGILGQGLKIAPPEAPVTGYMFGKGVYFADISSKSANYCFATKTKNVGLLLLCEVSLGNMNDKLAADYSADKLPKGKHSVRGLGKIGPDPKDKVTLPDGLVVPVGKEKEMGVKNPPLIYNEFIVYDTKQIRMKYLLKVKFHFN